MMTSIETLVSSTTGPFGVCFQYPCIHHALHLLYLLCSDDVLWVSLPSLKTPTKLINQLFRTSFWGFDTTNTETSNFCWMSQQNSILSVAQGQSEACLVSKLVVIYSFKENIDIKCYYLWFSLCNVEVVPYFGTHTYTYTHMEDTEK